MCVHECMVCASMDCACLWCVSMVCACFGMYIYAMLHEHVCIHICWLMLIYCAEQFGLSASPLEL